MRASLACCSAAVSTDDGMPSSFVSSWIAVTNSARAGDLEVHVAERVFGAEDVGQRRVAGLTVDLVGDEAHRDARDRRAQRHTGVQQRQGRRADGAHRRRAVGAQRLGDLTDRVRELLARWAAPARARARRGSRARSRDASATRRGRSHRSSRAGSCSGAGSACASPGDSESICCSILSMFSVVTPRIWVSPRWKIAEP